MVFALLCMALIWLVDVQYGWQGVFGHGVSFADARRLGLL